MPSLYISQAYNKKLHNNWSFKRFANYLSIAAYTLAVFILVFSFTVMDQLRTFQYDRVLGNYPIIVSTPIDQAQHKSIQEKGWSQIELQNILDQLPEIKRIEPYDSQEIILQANDSLSINRLVGVENLASIADDKKTYIYQDPLENKFTIVLPLALYNQLGLPLGTKVTLINRNKTHYLPSGPSPVQRQFTIGGFYLDNNIDAPIYTSDQSFLRFNLDSSKHLAKLRFYFDPYNTVSILKQINDLGFNSEDWRTSKGLFFASINTEHNMMIMIASLLIVTALFTNLISFCFLILDRDMDLAMFSILGMSNRKIIQIFLLQHGRFLIIGNIIFIVTTLITVWISSLVDRSQEITTAQPALIQLAHIIEFKPNIIKTLLIAVGTSGLILVSITLLAFIMIKIRPLTIIKQYA